eukprot:scaffold119719_cov19-Tisochrysis_lutea.AAC.3
MPACVRAQVQLRFPYPWHPPETDDPATAMASEATRPTPPAHHPAHHHLHHNNARRGAAAAAGAGQQHQRGAQRPQHAQHDNVQHVERALGMRQQRGGLHGAGAGVAGDEEGVEVGGRDGEVGGAGRGRVRNRRGIFAGLMGWGARGP